MGRSRTPRPGCTVGSTEPAQERRCRLCRRRRGRPGRRGRPALPGPSSGRARASRPPRGRVRRSGRGVHRRRATPAVAGMARRFGAVDQPDERRIHRIPIPRLGGIAMFFGIIVPSLAFLDLTRPVRGVLIGCAVATGGRRDRRLPRPRLVGEARRAGAGCLDPGRLRRVGRPLHLPVPWRLRPTGVGGCAVDRHLDRRRDEHGQLPRRARRPRRRRLRHRRRHLP